jgi:hypothetical protein
MNALGNEVVIQDWTSICGIPAATDIVQDPCMIVDTMGFSWCRLHALIPDTGTEAQVKIDGASSLDGPWTEGVVALNPTAGTPGEFVYELEAHDSATHKLYRYLRWRVSTGSGPDTVCFTILGTFR